MRERGQRQSQDITAELERSLLVLTGRQQPQCGQAQRGVSSNAAGGDHSARSTRSRDMNETPHGIRISQLLVVGVFEEFFVDVFSRRDVLRRPCELLHVERSNGRGNQPGQFRLSVSRVPHSKHERRRSNLCQRLSVSLQHGLEGVLKFLLEFGATDDGITRAVPRVQQTDDAASSLDRDLWNERCVFAVRK